MKEGDGVKIRTKKRQVLMPSRNESHWKIQPHHDRDAGPNPETSSAPVPYLIFQDEPPELAMTLDHRGEAMTDAGPPLGSRVEERPRRGEGWIL